jgi:hypothetical protein
MKWYQAILTASVAIAFLASCEKKSSRFAPEPHITFNYIKPDSVRNLSGEDTVYIGFHFTDGDADLGNDPNTLKRDIFMIDNRFPNDTTSFYFPSIPGEIKDPEKGMEGDCDFFVPAAFIQGLRDTVVHKHHDTTTFNIFIKDIAGHVSNIITTDTLIIYQR